MEATIAMNEKDRDRLMREVMAETAEKERGRLLTIASKTAPKRVAFVDWVILVPILSKIGIVNLRNRTDRIRDARWSYKADKNGRIMELRIGGVRDLDPFDVPAGIVRLERLKLFSVTNCLSIPVELSSLSHLKELHLLESDEELLNDFPLQMVLSHLTRLEVSDCRLQSSSPFLIWMTRQLPRLEIFGFMSMGKEEANYILDSFRNSENVCFKENLKRFDMQSCRLDDKCLETLLLDILPKVPNVSSLDLEGNNIKSVRAIIDRIKSDETCFVSKSIRCLKIEHNPILEKMEDNPKEKASILSFLRTFNTIFKLFDGHLQDEEGNSFDSDVEYALRINHAGRSIVEGNYVGTKK